MIKLRSLLANLLVIILTGVAITAVSAQELCEILVRDVWESVTENCDGLGLDAACYGNESLNATFSLGNSTTAFSSPGDQDAISVLQTIRTTAFDEADEEWGIGDFLIPAEPFGGTADQKVVVFTAGDVIVENAVPEDSELLPMQAFNFTTGGKSECREAPNAIFIQSPKELKVNLNVNSTPIRLGSTVMAGTEPDPETGLDIMWFIVLDGTLTLYPDTANAITIPAGGFSTTLLSDENGKGLNGETIIPEADLPVLEPETQATIPGIDDIPFYRQKPIRAFTRPQPLTPDGAGYQGWDMYYFARLIPAELLNYPVNLPTLPEENQVVVNSNNPPAQPTTVPVSVPVNNWCASGGKWANTCDHADPDVTTWYWTTGWYCAALESKLIDAVPAPYDACAPRVAETLPPTASNTAPPSLTPSNTPTFTPTFTPTNTPTNTLTFTPTFTPSNTPTFTPTFTPTVIPLVVSITECTQINADSFWVTFKAESAPIETAKITVYNASGLTTYDIALPPAETRLQIGTGRLPFVTARAFDAANTEIAVTGITGLICEKP